MYHARVVSEEREGSSMRLWLRLTSELAYFAGHFPAWPVLPGIVQVHWAIEYARRGFHGLEMIRGIENLKFNRVVQPDLDLELTLRHDTEKNILDFHYDEGATRYSSGRVIFTGSP